MMLKSQGRICSLASRSRLLLCVLYTTGEEAGETADRDRRTGHSRSRAATALNESGLNPTQGPGWQRTRILSVLSLCPSTPLHHLPSTTDAGGGEKDRLATPLIPSRVTHLYILLGTLGLNPLVSEVHLEGLWSCSSISKNHT